MITETQEEIDLRSKSIQKIPSTTFYAIIDRIKEHKTPSRVLANDFHYPMAIIHTIRSKAISLGLLERPVGVVKMMKAIQEKKDLGIVRKRKVSKKEVSKNIKINIPTEKESLPTSKFVNIKFGEIEVVVEKSSNIVITKDKIAIN